MWRCTHCRTIVEVLTDRTRCNCPNPDPEDAEWVRIEILRPSVAAFAQAMEQKLKENDYKGHWDHCSMQYLSMRLTQEREELRRAVERADSKEVLREAADVANFAMMIAENVAARSCDHGFDPETCHLCAEAERR